MLFELILLSVVGTVFIIMGLVIWKKQKISLISSINSSKVSAENTPAFTAVIGKALIIIGIGIILTGVFDYGTLSMWGRIFFIATFAIGMIMMIYATKKYNRCDR
ncbi:MAG: DUF3784 domain-containing protein [Clostridia bacterium]|nr:DUF3784 domain-containing protein [Clostridia bacterium]